MKCQAGLAFAFMILASPASEVVAQTAPQASQTPSFSTHSSLVVVPALVRSKAGSLVYTLTADDFVLADNGVPQKLTLEQDTGGEPLALVVAIEVGGAGAREFNKYSSIAPPLAPMLESIVGNVPHKVAVVTFDSAPTLLQGFTSDTAAAADAIQTLMPGCTRQHHLMNCASPLAIHDVGLGDNGAAILDALGYSVDLLRDQPRQYRRAILLISDTNTTIYSIGFSTGKSETAHYAARELPTQPGELWMENHHPNPQNGCMGKDPDPDPDATHNKAIQAYDCLTQLAPPLALAKMAAIEATDGLKRNIPETVAHLTGGEYFKLTDLKSLERSLAAISNHIPNRYVLSYQPQSPTPGLHLISVHLQNYSNLKVTARSSYWAEVETTPAN
jgi:VWFA-related protein